MSSDAKQFKSLGLAMFFVAFVAAIFVGKQIAPTWTVEKFALPVQTNDEGQEFVNFNGEALSPGEAIPLAESSLTVDHLAALHQQNEQPKITEQLVYATDEAGQKEYAQLSAHRHWGWWSFLPALTAIALCWITKEPITSLLAGIVVGAMLIGHFNVLDGVLIPSIGTPRAATILVLYLWLLGGLMGIWAKTGASEAFADYMSAKFVRGPRTAKLVAWFLGVIFFQGGTVSAVLVGTTVRPLADEEKSEPRRAVADRRRNVVANCGTARLQRLAHLCAGLHGRGGGFVFGDRRIAHCVFLSQYPARVLCHIFGDRDPLDCHRKAPCPAEETQSGTPAGTRDGRAECPRLRAVGRRRSELRFCTRGFLHLSYEIFYLPLLTLLGVAVGTYLALGSPKVLWAFGAALLLAAILAAVGGMTLQQIMLGIVEGQKGVVLGSVILLLAITVGNISQDVGGGRYLVSLLGELEMFWLLPGTAFGIAVVIAFSTGTSWATFAVTLPLVMPLAYAVGVKPKPDAPRVVSVDLFCCVPQRWRVWRPVLADF